MEDGATVEVGLAGNDGVLGTSLFLGGKTTTNRAVVGIAGEAVRVGAWAVRDQFMRGGALQRVLLAYTSALIIPVLLEGDVPPES